MGPPSPATSCWPCAPSSGGGRPPSAPPGDGWDEGAATAFAFVLLPMLRAALLSTVPSAPSVSFSASADETNRLLEVGAATGSAEELSRLRRAGNVRVLRLHGTRAEGGEEDLAAMESPDYCRAVRDAFALGRRMEARMAARREVQTQVQQQAQEEGAIDRLERWYLFHLAAWARTYVTRADLRRALPPSASAGLLHRHQHHHHLPSPPPPPAVAVPPVDRIADRLVALGLLLPRSGGGRGGCVGPEDDGGASYWFALPGLGRAAAAVLEGRGAVLAKLRRSGHRELRRSSIEAGEAGGGVKLVPPAFTVRDLLSRGVVTVRETPAGQFLRLRSG